MNMGIQGLRCMFIILFGISLIDAMIWNLRMSKAFAFRSKQEEALHDDDDEVMLNVLSCQLT